MQLCNLVLFVAMNGLFMSVSWQRFGSCVRWVNLGMFTCWNTVHPIFSCHVFSCQTLYVEAVQKARNLL